MSRVNVSAAIIAVIIAAATAAVLAAGLPIPPTAAAYISAVIGGITGLATYVKVRDRFAKSKSSTR